MLRRNTMPTARTEQLRLSERDYARATKVVRQRFGGVCEMHGGHRATEFQHRVRRGMGGSARNVAIHRVSSLLHVCRAGGYDADHDPDRYGYGWSVHRGQDTTVVPVLLADGWWFLDDEGGRCAAPDGGDAA
jgi:hypothetical protein